MLTAASKVPGRNGIPWPISERKRSPSTSRCNAISSIEGEMSSPIHVCGPPSSGEREERILPESPEPQPTSRIKLGDERERRESARWVICDWMDWIREEVG